MIKTYIRRACCRLGFVLLFFCVLWNGLTAQEPDRTRPPELGPPPTLKLPAIQHLQLSNGLPVVLMEKHEVPLVQIILMIRTGTAMDPANKIGLASMTMAMLDEGAGSRNALELADAIDFLGARISTSVNSHTSEITLHTPLAKLEGALPLMADITMRPNFPPKELERLRKQRLTTLLQWRDEPRAIASVLFDRTLFGTKHPYGWPEMGDAKSLRAIDVKSLRQFHDTFFHPKNATLIVVGDVTASTLLPKLQAAFGEWQTGQIPEKTWPEVPQVKNRQIYLVDKPGAAQSEIRIGRIGVARSTEDYYAIVVMNTILGGSFSSRLNQNLREEHGYSYGAYSYFSFRLLPGPFQAAAAVQTAVTDKALAEFMKELTNILQPVSDQELTRAKNYVALGFPENFQTVSRVANQIEDLVIYNLPDAYFNNYVERILAVSKEDVQRVAEKYLDPQRVAIVIVGDRKEIEPGVRALNLGPLHTLTIKDVLGPAPVVEGTK